MPRPRRHFKVLVEWSTTPGMEEIWSKLEMRASFISLGVFAVDQFPQRDGGRFRISNSQLPEVLGCKSPAAAVQRLASLLKLARASAELLGCSPHLTGRQVGSIWLLEMPNYAKDQAFNESNDGEPAPPEAEAEAEAEAETGSEPLSSSQDDGVVEGQENDPEKKPDPAIQHPDAERLARLMSDGLRREVEGFTPPSPAVFRSRWCVDMDRLLRLDGPERSGIPPERVEAVIVWCAADTEFEQANVQCPEKLRKRFGALEVKVRRPQRVGPQSRRQMLAIADQVAQEMDFGK